MASVSEWGKDTRGTDVVRRFAGSVRGKVVIITGVSPKSLGEPLATAVAAHAPALLILASRTPSKVQSVASNINTTYPNVNIACIQVDFSSFPSVRHAASEITSLLQKQGKRIEILFNNAGISIVERRLNANGIELQFATNHLGPFLFTNLLLPFIKGRIVNTSSESHRISPVRFSDVNQTPGVKVPEDEEPRRGLPEGILRGTEYEPDIAYGQSKTANILFAVELNRRFGKEGVTSFACMPGTIMTDIVRDLDQQKLDEFAKIKNWKTLDQGVASMLVAAFDPALSTEDGVYLDDCQFRRPSKWASDPEKAERLWRLSEELVGQKFSHEGKSRL